MQGIEECFVFLSFIPAVYKTVSDYFTKMVTESSELLMNT